MKINIERLEFSRHNWSLVLGIFYDFDDYLDRHYLAIELLFVAIYFKW